MRSIIHFGLERCGFVLLALSALVVTSPLVAQESAAAALGISGGVEQAILERLTPQQAEAFLAGADPASIVLEDGTTLEELLLEGLIDTASSSVYHPLNQCLVVRTASGLGGGKYVANVKRDHTVRGTCGVPLEATAVVMNAKLYAASGSGQVFIYPVGHTATPAVVNVRPSQTVNNMVTVALGSAGDFSVKPSVAVHAVIHTVGYFAPLGSSLDADTLDGMDSTEFATLADTLAGLGCADGQLAKWNASLAQWQCAADADTNTDTLATLDCADGEVARWNDIASQWECTEDQIADTTALAEGLCRLYQQTDQQPYPDFCDVEPVSGSVDITGQVVGQVAVNPATDRVYIGSNYSLSLQPLTVIDVSDKTNPTVVTTVTGSGATTNPATNRFYAKGGTGFSGTFLVYNGVDNSLITTVPIGYCGGRLATDVTTNLIYMTSECGAGNDPLHVLNGATDTLAAGPLQSGGIVGTVAVNSATGNAYVARTGGTRVFGPAPGFAVITDLAGIACVAVNPVTNRIYCAAGADLEVRSGVDHSLITTISGVANVFGVNTTRNRIYVSDQTNQVVKVIDGVSNTVIGDISLGAGVTPGPGAVDSTKNRLYVSGYPPGSTWLFVVTDTLP